jgi:hypothetical protein
LPGKINFRKFEPASGSKWAGRHIFAVCLGVNKSSQNRGVVSNLPEIWRVFRAFMRKWDWHAICNKPGMRIAMDMRPLFDEEETQRQQQLRDQFVRDYRARWHTGLLRRIFGGVRRIFLFLLAAAMVTFVIWWLNGIDSVSAQ